MTARVTPIRMQNARNDNRPNCHRRIVLSGSLGMGHCSKRWRQIRHRVLSQIYGAEFSVVLDHSSKRTLRPRCDALLCCDREVDVFVDGKCSHSHRLAETTCKKTPISTIAVT